MSDFAQFLHVYNCPIQGFYPYYLAYRHEEAVRISVTDSRRHIRHRYRTLLMMGVRRCGLAKGSTGTLPGPSVLFAGVLDLFVSVRHA
jgi:hypothetical protein